MLPQLMNVKPGSKEVSNLAATGYLFVVSWHYPSLPGVLIADA